MHIGTINHVIVNDAHKSVFFQWDMKQFVHNRGPSYHYLRARCYLHVPTVDHHHQILKVLLQVLYSRKGHGSIKIIVSMIYTQYIQDLFKLLESPLQ